eukprot:4828077-Prymnesium_polylepis.1
MRALRCGARAPACRRMPHGIAPTVPWHCTHCALCRCHRTRMQCRGAVCAVSYTHLTLPTICSV